MGQKYAISLFLSITFLLLASCTHPSKKHHHHGAVHHDFKDAQAWSQKFDAPDRDGWQKPEEIVRVMKIKRGEKVADIGAGTGYLLEHLDKAVGPKGRVYALDVEQSLVDFMKERIKTEKLASSEAALIPFDSPGQLVKQADKVVVLNTWHHIQNRKAYSKKLFSLLPKGGQVFIVDPEIGKGGPGPKDLHRMPPTKVVAELASGGFLCQIAEENLGHQYIVVCRKD